MKRVNPGIDRTYVSIDQLALYKSIINKTGMGKIPEKYEEVGWFGAEEHKTILLDCGCGGKDKCDSLTVYFCVVEADKDSYYLIVDRDGEFIQCRLQNFERLKRAKKIADIIEAIEATNLKLQELYDEYDKLAKPYIDRMMGDIWKLSLEDIETKHASDIEDANLYTYVLDTFNTIYWMVMNHTEQALNEETWEYKKMIDDGQTIEQVLKLMKSRKVSKDATQEVLEYGQDLILAKGQSTIFTNPKTNRIQ